MKRFLFVAAVAAIALPALAADAGVSVQIGEPGFYGSIDIGGFPQPQVILPAADPDPGITFRCEDGEWRNLGTTCQ
jgi:hypothetical protein